MMKAGSDVNIKTLVVGPIQACCYVVSGKINNRVCLIDPGGDSKQIIDYLEKHKLEPVYLINTHGHIDHIGANQEIKAAYPAIKICIHSEDARMLTSASANLSPELGYSFTSPSADKLLKEGDELSINDGALALKVIHLPGHTRGGIGLVYTPSGKQPGIIFTGDTLFAGGIGRTDFPGGSMEQLLNNIRTKILTLPDDTVVYPGHGPATTVGNEKHHNPFLTGEF